MLIGFMFISAVKLRKSPFDLSTSHHAHQEMVKGLTTEMAGPTLAIMNIAESVSYTHLDVYKRQTYSHLH